MYCKTSTENLKGLFSLGLVKIQQIVGFEDLITDNKVKINFCRLIFKMNNSDFH